MTGNKNRKDNKETPNQIQPGSQDFSGKCYDNNLKQVNNLYFTEIIQNVPQKTENYKISPYNLIILALSNLKNSEKNLELSWDFCFLPCPWNILP